MDSAGVRLPMSEAAADRLFIFTSPQHYLCCMSYWRLAGSLNPKPSTQQRKHRNSESEALNPITLVETLAYAVALACW